MISIIYISCISTANLCTDQTNATSITLSGACIIPNLPFNKACRLQIFAESSGTRSAQAARYVDTLTYRLNPALPQHTCANMVRYNDIGRYVLLLDEE